MKKNRIQNSRFVHQSGFTLVEVMMAAAVATIIGLGIAQMMTDMAWRQRMVVQLMNIQDLRLGVGNAVQDRDGCTATLGGLDIKATSANAVNIPARGIRDSGMTTLIYTDTAAPKPTTGKSEYGSDAAKVIVKRIAFWSTSPPTNNILVPGVLAVEYEKTLATGKQTGVAEIEIKLMPTGSGGSAKVAWCYGSDTNATQVCSFYGGTFNAGTGLCETFSVPTGTITNANLTNAAISTANVSGNATVTGTTNLNGATNMIGLATAQGDMNVNGLATLARARINNGLTVNQLKSPPGQDLIVTTDGPTKGICLNGGCKTTFKQTKCPGTAYPADYVYVVGISEGGSVICGKRAF